MNQTSEKRKDRRLDLSLGIEFTPGNNSGVPVPCRGTTHNVSAGGVYFETSSGYPISNGAEVLLKMALPERVDGSAEPLVLHCKGTVCRIEALNEGGERFGIAVRFNDRPNIEFQSLSKLLWDLSWES
jgi:hypothetical protein